MTRRAEHSKNWEQFLSFPVGALVAMVNKSNPKTSDPDNMFRVQNKLSEFCQREDVSTAEVLMSVLFTVWDGLDPDRPRGGA